MTTQTLWYCNTCLTMYQDDTEARQHEHETEDSGWFEWP